MPARASASNVGISNVGMVIGALLTLSACGWGSVPHEATAGGLAQRVSSSRPQTDAGAGEMAAPHRQASTAGNPPTRSSFRARDVTERPPRIPHDLRRPRPPRQRSERPTTGLALLGDVLMLELLEFLDDPRGGRFVPFPVAIQPLAGHPSAILRPPSPRN